MSVYDCNICSETHELDAEWAADLSICTDCWFGYLDSSDRRAIAKRIGL